jgi:thioesterase domain-containing protein/acyl carrier protein
MKTLDTLLSELRHQDVQLWLEGDRLRYRAPEGRLSPENLTELRDRKAEIIVFLQAAKQLSSQHQPPLQSISREGYLPLSFAQQRFWFLYQFEPDSPANNMPVVVRFTGKLHLATLERSIAEVARRHEVLRSRFPMVDGQPVLVIDPEFEVKLPLVDLRAIPDDQRDEETRRVAAKDARQPFDLEKDTLLRVTLFRVSDQEHLLLWNIPCIICDGTSSDLFYRELMACYIAYATDTPLNLPELQIQYADFAHWQRQYLQGEVLDSHLNYWQQQLSDSLTSLQLPTDYSRPSGLRTCRGDRYGRMLPKSLHQNLLTLSQQLGTTLFVVLLSTFDVLLHRYSQQDDVLTTFVSSGRNQVEIENLIGFFSNSLILRTHFHRELTFRELVQRVHRQNLDAYAHQELPFERLIDGLSPEQRQGRSPLFQTKFTLNPPWTNGQGMAPVALPDLTIESLFGYIYHGKTKYDLILVTREQDQGLGAVIDYNAELFAESTIERMMGHFQTLLESVVANPDQAICTMPMLTTAEQQLLVDWSQTKKDLSTILSGTEFLDHLQRSQGAIKDLTENAQTYILDRYSQPVPIGIAGELHIGGVNWNQDDTDLLTLTNHLTFDSWAKGSATRLCKTGATTRYLPDGKLELFEHIDTTTIERGVLESPTPAVTSRDAIERDLTEIWKGLLGVEAIGIQENFFDLGGQSLTAVRLFAQIEDKFGKRLPLSTLLKAPTIEQLAIVLRGKESADVWSPLVEIQTGGSNLPLFCIHGGGFNVLIYRHLAVNLGVNQPVYGLQARGIDSWSGDSLAEIAADYIKEIQRVQAEGPYLLAGLSNGGDIALEMAQQLQAKGQTVALLAMFDSVGPEGIKLMSPLPRLLSSLYYVLQFSVPRLIASSQQSGLDGVLTKLKSRWLDYLSGYKSPSVPQKNLLKRRIDYLSHFILEHSPYGFYAPSAQLQGMNDTVSNTLKQMEESYSKVYKAYAPQPYPGKITLFQAMEFPPGYRREPSLGWDKIAKDGVEVHDIPGHHTSIMESPILFEKMRDCIERAIDPPRLL